MAASASIAALKTLLDTLVYTNTSNAITGDGLNAALDDIIDTLDALKTGPEIFWATYGTTTAAEIDAAVQAGKIPVCKYTQSSSERTFVFSGIIYGAVSYNFYQFTAAVNDQLWYVRVRSDNDSWSNGVYTLQKLDNKVTSWQTTPDDTHYPSEKLVKDYVDGLVGNIETLLAAI